MPPIDLKALEINLGGRDRPDFGTVRPRVQIPGPRPKSEDDSGVTAHAAMAMDHSWITIPAIDMNAQGS
jgi:hypothetical protein